MIHFAPCPLKGVHKNFHVSPPSGGGGGQNLLKGNDINIMDKYKKS